VVASSISGVIAQEANLSFDAMATMYLNRVANLQSPGVSVLVAREGTIAFQGAAGLANLEKKEPITTDTKFRIGSITKQFTAMGILKLVEAGKLSLRDPLTKFFPDYPKAAGITLEHLLTHTSGLHSYTEKPDFYSRVTKGISPQEMIAWFRNDPCDFAPGAGFHYCNSGYFLLGEIIAQASDKSYGDYLKDTIFAPLGMNNTGVFVNAQPPENMAIGYSLNDGKYVPALDWDMSWAGAAGAIYSTVGDLFRWNEALYGGRVVSAKSLAAATTPAKLPEGVDGMHYGYGLIRAENRRLPVISHSGGLNGWSSDLVYYPEQKCTVVVLTNAFPLSPELTPQVISQLFGEKFLVEEIKKLPVQEVDRSVDPKSFGDYVGRYDYKQAVMTISTEGENLFAQLTGQPKLAIYPKGKDQFFWKVVDAEVAFQRDGQGKVESVRHTQGGNSFTALKLSDEVPNLSTEQLEQFVGRYRYGLAVMTTTREGDQLFAQLTNQPKFPIFPKTAHVFEWKVVEAKVEFLKNNQGIIVAARHTQNGVTFDAPKIEE
jgi:CubicO group peptidase (beta-lactamase class C family)